MDPRWQEALDLTKGVTASPKSIERAAKQLGYDLARLAFAQWALRDRAQAKFERADEMLFDRPGLEMATHEKVAAFHASRFPTGVLVADLTTGIGADLIALARRGPVMGFENDPVRAEYARHNLPLQPPSPGDLSWGGEPGGIAVKLAAHDVEFSLRPFPLRGMFVPAEGEGGMGVPEPSDPILKPMGQRGEVRTADCLAAEWDFEYAFADPARRVESARTWNPDEFTPHPIRLADRLKSLKLGVIKLSPMLRDEFFRHFDGRLEFVSFAGECRESLVWMGTEAGTGRAAVRAEDGETLEAGPDADEASEASGFLFEADPAVIRAHALGPLAHRHGLRMLAESNGYLTGPSMVASPWLTPYEVLADHPADPRRSSGVLRSLGAGTPIVKSRVPRLDVETLRRQLRGEGRELIVAAYPAGKQIRHAIIAKLPRMQPPSARLPLT